VCKIVLSKDKFSGIRSRILASKIELVASRPTALISSELQSTSVYIYRRLSNSSYYQYMDKKDG